jgi:hypothetical protein
VSKSGYHKLGQKQRARVFALLVKRDGARCSICQKRGNEKSLVVDCIDNSGDHSRLENLQLLCRSHNTRKNPRGVGRFHPSKLSLGIQAIERPPVSTLEMLKNQECEPLFLHWLFGNIRAHGWMYLSDVLNGGAEYAGLSQTTVRRYLDKKTSVEGKYELAYHDEDNKPIVRFRRSVAFNIERNEQLERLKDDALAGAGPS